MRRIARHLAPLLALLAFALNGCAYGLYEDQRLMDTITDDKALATAIKTALLKEDFGDGVSIAVYSYYSNVFLVGEVPDNMQGKAVAIARGKSPRTVTPHWFSPAKGETSDMVLAARLRSALISTKGLSSTRIDTEVNADRVVLLGVVADNDEKRLAIQTASQVKGVHTVTSYLMLPQRKGSIATGGESEEVLGDSQTAAPMQEKEKSGVGSHDLP